MIVHYWKKWLLILAIIIFFSVITQMAIEALAVESKHIGSGVVHVSAAVNNIIPDCPRI